MAQLHYGFFWRSVGLAVVLWMVVAYPACQANEAAPVKNVGQQLADGDPTSALITLKNAARQSPQDPALHTQLARVYLRLGDTGSAEREARAARELNADEAD